MTETFASVFEKFLPSIIMAFIGILLNRQERKRTAKQEEHQKNISSVITHLITCTLINSEGTVLLARAVQNDDRNGGLTAAMDRLQQANEECKSFVISAAANGISK